MLNDCVPQGCWLPPGPIEEPQRPPLQRKQCGCLAKITWAVPKGSAFAELQKLLVAEGVLQPPLSALIPGVGDDDDVSTPPRSLADTSGPSSGNNSGHGTPRGRDPNRERSDSWGWYEGTRDSWSYSDSDHEGAVRYAPGHAASASSALGRDGMFEQHMAGTFLTNRLSSEMNGYYSSSEGLNGVGRVGAVPEHVLEEPFSAQVLWHFTAGAPRLNTNSSGRPGGSDERARAEALWAKGLTGALVTLRAQHAQAKATSATITAEGNYAAGGAVTPVTDVVAAPEAEASPETERHPHAAEDSLATARENLVPDEAPPPPGRSDSMKSGCTGGPALEAAAERLSGLFIVPPEPLLAKPTPSVPTPATDATLSPSSSNNALSPTMPSTDGWSRASSVHGGDCSSDGLDSWSSQPQPTVLFRGSSPFATSVTKTFTCDRCGDAGELVVRVPRFQVLRAAGRGGAVHAEFLVVLSFGSNITLGAWRRFSDFAALAHSVSKGAPSPQVRDQFRMSHFSWAVLMQRKRPFRCLDRDYLSLKCFLLERFLHDLVFESHSPATIRDFLGMW